LFVEYSSQLKDATYIFVAKNAINEISHQRLEYDFKKILSKAKSFKKVDA
jgi:RNase P protein component